MNTDMLGISELKWTEMDKFNSDYHYIYYCGKESFRRNEAALIVNKRVRNAVLGCSLKNDRMISVHFQGKPFNITSLCLQDLELTPKQDVIFIIGNWNAKVGSQEIPGVTGKFGPAVQSEATQRLTEFSQENTLVIANTLFQQHER